MMQSRATVFNTLVVKGETITKEDVRAVVKSELSSVHVELSGIHTKLDELKEDMNEGFRKTQEQIDKVEGKIDVINIESYEKTAS